MNEMNPSTHAAGKPEAKGGAVRFPGEWEPQARVFVSRPNHHETWPIEADLEAARREWDALVEAIGEVTPVTDVAELEVPVDDAWVRDTAPLFVETTGGGLHAQCFKFTAYGYKWEYERDAKVGTSVAAALGVPSTLHPLGLEGGAIESNGRGVAISTAACTLDEARNPGLSRDRLEAALAESLGIETLVLLDAALPGDHTDGHIDNTVRFVAEDRVLAVEPFVEAARAELEPLGIAVDALPMAEPWEYTYPPHVPDPGTHPLPASYANFLITNGRVILPAYGQPTDADAASVLRKAFPDREVVTLPARHILIGGGSFHCLTMQLPVGSTIRA